MISKEQAYLKIQDLVTRFEEQLASYKKAEYNETLTRRDFIDPFFKALGWDIDNEQGYAEAYREVIHEDKIKIGKATKAPDYSFRLSGGKRLFFVEAKKPSVAVKEEIAPAYQVRRYGWSAKLPISIITDFEELAVYDCTKKPNPNDKASVARIHYLTFREYLTQFDFLWDTFSKERVLKGSFDKYVQSTANKKGTATVDAAFLQSLDSWRTLLAENIAKCNKELNEDEINFVVQQTIDRIIFLRIAEDRGVEPYGNILSIVKHTNYYQTLFAIFKQADDKYNSGLFDFKKDALSKNLTIDNKILKSIANQLYYPESPYEFSVLSVEILGSAYEQFLGKQITLSKSGKAIIEEKPEVRKAGGVYYTPQYIVDYIVQNTVGKLCEGKTPKQVAELRICDPACGSGSFLLGAYSYLLQWHKDYYTQEGKVSKNKTGSPLTPDGNLTTSEKKRILLNNIYGVDIDVNAVEVTKLSLLLKCMEGETSASIANQMSMFNERVLPTLDSNIKSGNSLIDLDYYDTQLDFGDEKKIKPFSWQKGFPEVFSSLRGAAKQSGFDVVIGNPPYVFGRDWKGLGITDNLKNYLGNRYKSSPYQLDFFSMFMEKGVELSNKNGVSSFIVPNVWLSNTFSKSTRKYLFSNNKDVKITVPNTKVFEGITVDTVIYFCKKTPRSNKEFDINRLEHSNESLLSKLNYLEYENGEKPISTSLSAGWNSLLEKILESKSALGELADITRGVHPYRVGGYGQTAFGNGVQTQKDVEDRPYHSRIPKKNYRPFVYGKDLKYFNKVVHKEYIHYGKWLAEPRDKKYFEGDRIYSRKILGKTLIVTIEKGDSVADQQVYITKPKSNDIPIQYFASILGSKMMSFFIKNYFDEVNDAFPQIKVGQLKSLPIKVEGDKYFKPIIELVELMLNLNDELKNSSLETQKEQIQNRISYCEDKINSIVYELYGLTEEEIKIIENK
jgi:type I restriction-modification system DNA methylase subunit